MKLIGFLECVWREGDSLFGSIKLNAPLPWGNKFVVRGHLEIRGFTHPDSGHLRLIDVALSEIGPLSKWKEWSVQDNLSKVGLVKADESLGYRDHDINCLEKDIVERGLEGYKIPVIICDRECCDF